MLKELLKSKLEKVKPEKMGMEMESKHFPMLHLSSDNLSEIKDWDVGEDYHLVLKVKQKSKNEDDKMTNASFDIIEIGVLDEESEDDMGDEEGDMSMSKSKLMKKYA